MAALFDFLQRSGLSGFAGQVTPKNGWDGPWFSDMDIRIQQDFRLPWGWAGNDHSVSVFLDLENALNLFLGDDNNVRNYTNTGDIEEGVRVLEVLGDLSNTDQFVVSDWFDEGVNQDVDDSVWRIQLGIRYRF